jgi:hypothetical protein
VNNNEITPSAGADDSKETDQETAERGFIEQQKGSPAQQTARDNKQHSHGTPKPIFPIRAWRWLAGWWKNPFRPRGNFPEHLTVVVSVVIAVIAVLQWSVYRQQKKIMEGAGTQTQQLIDAANIQACAATKNAAAADKFAASAEGINTHTKDAVDEFRRLAKASEGNIAAIRESARLEQRAWVSAGESGPLIDPAAQTLRMKVTVANSGKTFALKTGMAAFASFADHEITTYQELEASTHTASPSSTSLLAPGSSYDSPIDIDPTALPAIKNKLSGGGYVYIWGEISYFDVFKGQHTTDYCAYRKEPAKDVAFFQCKFHNDAN